MHIAIIGLPSSGKTTLFNALTHGQAETGTYHAGTFNVNMAAVTVPDARVDRLSALYRPKKTVYAQVQFKDVAGIEGGSAKGSALSGRLLNELSGNDAFLHVVRAFTDPAVPHPSGRIDPQRDYVALEAELILSDMAIVEKRLERLRKERTRSTSPAELPLMERLLARLEAEQPLRGIDLSGEEDKLLRSYGLLSLKPMVVVVNVGDDADLDQAARQIRVPAEQVTVLPLRGKLEMELAQMAADEAAEFLADFGLSEPGLARVIAACYDLLGVHSFFTVGEDEVRAWTVRRGANALEAAGAIHTDLAKGFIRAEVVAYADLIAAGSIPEARKIGKFQLEGRDYVVRDGDIVHVRFNL
jgi:hypothetical protein